MKTQFLSLLVAVLGCSAALGGTTTITDFTTIKGGTAVDGITLTATNVSLTSTGGLSLKDGSLAFDFMRDSNNKATNTPNLKSGNQFSLALTFDLSSLQGTTTPLFSTTWYKGANHTTQEGAYNGLYGAQFVDGVISIGYFNESQNKSNQGFNGQSVTVNDTAGTLTIIWTRKTSNLSTFDIYVGQTQIDTIANSAGADFDGLLDTLTVGGKGVTASGNLTNSYATTSSATLMGMQVVSGSVMDSSAVSAYIASVPVAAIPEPATATLSLLALAGLAARRRRK